METIYESTFSYLIALVLTVLIIYLYIKYNKKKSEKTEAKIRKASELGLHEPVSLHPVVDINTCIGSGACITACPEKDILGIADGHAKVINASRCVGHGACFHACPMHAITLCIGTEKRGVDLPHVSTEFETNINGLFIAGELGGMGLIKNAVEQGRQAVEYITKKIDKNLNAEYDVVIIGAGPAGISATLTAEKYNLKYLTLEQDSLGGTVFNFPRSKIVMTSPMNIPLYGNVKLSQTSKTELLELWRNIISENKIKINEHEKVISIAKEDGKFIITTDKGRYSSLGAVLAIGRRGSPRKLGIPGEKSEKVFYRLLEPELIRGKNILIVGGGDSAIESALLLCGDNFVTVSYRGEAFSRLKESNYNKINNAVKKNKVKIIYNSSPVEIIGSEVSLSVKGQNIPLKLKNDLVYIFAGGELPNAFLEKSGIKITKKFGEAVLKYEKT